MDEFQFNHIGQMDITFPPQRRINHSSRGLSLLDRISQNEDAVTEIDATIPTDATPRTIRSPKATRQQKQRGHAEPSLADRISISDSPSLLNRISMSNVHPRMAEQKISPPTKRDSLDDSASPNHSAGAESPALSARLHNVSPAPAPVRNPSPTILIPTQRPGTPMEVVHAVESQIDPSSNSSTSTITSVTSSLAASTNPVYQSETLQPSSPTASNLNVQLPQLLSINVPNLPRNDTNANAQPPTPPSMTPPSVPSMGALGPPASVLPSVFAAATLSSSFKEATEAIPGTQTPPASSPPMNGVPTTFPQQFETLVTSPIEAPSDMLAFYFKPLWAESAAQMQEWAELAKERMHGEPDGHATPSLASEKGVRDSTKIGDARRGETEREKETAEETEMEKKDDDKEKEEKVKEAKPDHGLGRKRPRQETDEEPNAEAGVEAKRIKTSAILPPPVISPVTSLAEPEPVVVEERATIMDDASKNRGSLAAPRCAKVASAPASTHLAADVTTVIGGNPDLQTQDGLLPPAINPVAPDVAPHGRSSPSERPLPQRGVTPDTHSKHATRESHIISATDSSPTAKALDEASAIRKRHLEQELAFHQREEQERLRQLEEDRAKKAAVERMLKEREEELREAMKRRKMEKTQLQVMPSSPTVPIQVTVPTPAQQGEEPTPVAHSSPQRIAHPLPPKPKPLSGGVALGPSIAASAPGKTVPMVSPQAIAHNVPPISDPKKNKNKQAQKVSGSSASAPSGELLGSKPDPYTDIGALPRVSPPAIATSPPSVVAVKKEEPQTPSIPRTAVHTGPTLLKIPTLVLSTQVTPPHQPRVDKSSLDGPLEEKPLIKSEPAPEPRLAPSSVNAGKRPRSASLAASMLPAIKKQRESSPPAAELELTYPDGTSETSGWGQVDVDQDDEERRPGGRRRARTQTPEDVEGRERQASLDLTRPPSRLQRSLSRSGSLSRSRSRSRSQSPYRPTRDKRFAAKRDGDARGRRRAWNRHTRSSSPQQTARPRSVGGLRQAYDHDYSSRRPGLYAESNPPSRRNFEPRNWNSFDPYMQESGSWRDPKRHFQPPREAASFPRHHLPPAELHSQNAASSHLLLPRPPPGQSHAYQTYRVPPLPPSTIRSQNAGPSRQTRHISPLPRYRSPLHEPYHQPVPIGPSVAHSQDVAHISLPRPTSPRQPLRPRSPPREPYLHSRMPPVGPSGPHGPVPRRPSLDADGQGSVHRYQPYPVSRRTASAENKPVAGAPSSSTTYEAPSQPQRSLMARISRENHVGLERAPYASNTHQAYPGSDARSRNGSSQRGRGANVAANGGRMKLAARISDAGQ